MSIDSVLNTTDLGINIGAAGTVTINYLVREAARALSVDDAATGVVATVDRLRRRNSSTRPRVMAAHPGASTLVGCLISDDGARVLVVHGRAGSGKSTVVVEAIDRLVALGWVVSAVRMDAVEQVAHSARAVGEVFELPASPAVTLAAAAGESPCLLVVDQLDAVSLYSGRMPDSFDAVTEMLEQAQAHPSMKVLVVVRTVDLQNDPRMRSLLNEKDTVEEAEIGALSRDAVRQVLTAERVDPDKLGGRTLDLLRVPLHLAVFLHLPDEARVGGYRTLPELYEQFTRHIRRLTENDVTATDWQQTINVLVSYMSDHETLQAPSAVLDGIAISAVSALASAGVLIDDTVTVAFFHETYFDFLFARAFVAEGRELHDFLVSSGQHLFRRAQTRQVLEHLAAVDPGRFRVVVVRLLTSESIRVHLVDVAISVLRMYQPTADDWLALEPLAFGGSRRAGQLLGLLQLPGWFDAADAVGRWQILLSGSSTGDVAANQLIVAARERAERAVELVRPYVGMSDDWNSRLRAMVVWSLGPGLVDLTIELIERGVLDDAKGAIAVNSDFWSIIYSIANEEPAGTARIIGAYLRRAWTRAQADGSSNPFSSGYVTDTVGGAESLIRAVAGAAPERYLSEVLPFVYEVLEHTACGGSGDRPQSAMWRSLTIGAHGVQDALFEGLELALVAAAPRLYAAGDRLVDRLLASDRNPMRFLVCRWYTTLAERTANEAIDWLLSDACNLRLGWADSRAWATRQLIESVTAHCDNDRIEALSERLLNYYPAWELAAANLRARGYGQYELLSAIPIDRLTEVPRRRLQELDRKFGAGSLDPPQPFEFHRVESPVPEQAAEFMTDEDWRRAARRHSGERSRLPEIGVTGGAPQLAELLGRQAAKEPERFAQLALTFDPDLHPAYIKRTIEAVTGSLPVDTLARLCAHAREIADEAVGTVVCRAIAEVAAEAVEPMIDLLEHYAQSPDPDGSTASSPDSSSEPHRVEWLEDEGINCVRGLSARAIACVLTAQPDYAERLMPTIIALANDAVLAVRVQATVAIRVLLRSHPDEALQLADALFGGTEPAIFDSNTTMKLLLAAISRAPNRFIPYLTTCLTASDLVADRAGQIWAVALINGHLGDAAPDDPSTLTPAARNGAAKVFANSPEVKPQFVKALFDDDQPEVRRTASGALQHLDRLDATTAQDLVASFTKSAAFPEHHSTLFHALEQSMRILPETLLAACERVIDMAGSELGDIRTASAATSGDIVAVVLRLYRQGNQQIRTVCLDIIDRLSEVGALGLDTALAEER